MTDVGDVSSYRSSHLGAHRATAYDAGYSDDRTAKGLDWGIEQSLLDGILQRWPVSASGQALDLACGSGRLLAYLAARGPTPVGIDISAAMLSLARRRYPNVPLIRGDVTQTPLALAGQVELITAFRFFLNAEPALRADTLTVIRGLLRPTGALVANFHLNPFSIRGRYVRWRGGPEVNTMSVAEAVRLLDQHGLVAREVHGYSYLPYRRDGARLMTPRLRLRIETALAGDTRFTPLASCFLVVATPMAGPG